MNYNATTNTSPEDHNVFTDWLTERTVSALREAHQNETALKSAIEDYVAQATSAHLPLEEIEDLLGINEPCILDLAELSDEDEEFVVDIFETAMGN